MIIDKHFKAELLVISELVDLTFGDEFSDILTEKTNKHKQVAAVCATLQCMCHSLENLV